MKHLIISLIFIAITFFAYGQKERKYIRQGNKLYHLAIGNSDSTGIDSINFVKAEDKYRIALEKRPDDFKAAYNIGNAQFKQKLMADAAAQFEEVITTATTKDDKAKAYFNYGDALLGQQKLEESIEAFKNALRNNPKDMEAKYNLEFARKMKEQHQQQQQQNKDQNQDQDQDKNQDQKNKDQQNKDQQNKNQDQQQQQQQQPKISRQNAEQMLKALQNDEKDTQEKVKKAQAEKAKSSRPEIDW